MKKYQPWAIALCAAYLLSSFPNPLYNIILARYYGASVFGQMALHGQIVVAARAILNLLVSVIVAVWLFRLAKRDGAACWVWAMFGLFFSVLAAVLYFALQVYERLRNPCLCYSCGYDNREAIRSGRSECPECGVPIIVRTPNSPPRMARPLSEVATGDKER